MDRTNPRVLVLLSTYNGEKYLEEQINSILCQSYENISILVRDDGSSDNTHNILKKYAEKGDLSFYSGPNLGSTGCFIDLIKNADPAFEYYAFCDQDDVWLPDKIAEAVKSIKMFEGSDIPSVYACRSTIVNEDLEAIGKRNRFQAKLVPSYGNAIAQCILQGCTIVFDNVMHRELLAATPKSAIAHDWWIYMVAIGIGNVVIDPRSFVLYRQHASNVLGRPSILGRVKKYIRIYNQFGKSHALLDQWQEFANFYSNRLSRENIELLGCSLRYRDSFFSRLRLVSNPKIKRMSIVDDIIWRLVCLFDVI